MKHTRREFLKTTAVSLGFLGLRSYSRGAQGPAVGFGPLINDATGFLRLPAGFSCTVFSTTGELMNDGFYVPGAHDGMAAFAGRDGMTLLVRNHEMNPDVGQDGPFKGNGILYEKARAAGMFDASNGHHACLGGTTTIVFDTQTQRLVQHSLSLAGTIRNCSGGPTPWNSWITCEETVIRADDVFERDHGYCFEIPATDEMTLADPTPIKDMGRFNHEAVCVDPNTNIVYLTEDRPDGLIYRLLPNTTGELADGGSLQALTIKGAPSRDTRNWPDSPQEDFPTDEAVDVDWISLGEIDAPLDDLRYRGFEAGAARFARGEGTAFGNGAAYFACTSGGKQLFGQIFKYQPSPYEGTEREREQPGQLTLFIESHNSALMRSCDNLAIAPWGDVIICEDDGWSSALVGITPEGKLYHLAHVNMDSELAGACFSPDGTTLFVNIQRNPGQTLAITGPWSDRRV